MIGYYWTHIRFWIAGKIVGMDILDVVDSAYEAGREYGKTERWKKHDAPTV